MRPQAVTISAAGIRSPSSQPSARATAPLEVASARQPGNAASTWALSTSQAFGSTSIGGSRCMSRKRWARSLWALMAGQHTGLTRTTILL